MDNVLKKQKTCIQERPIQQTMQRDLYREHRIMPYWPPNSEQPQYIETIIRRNGSDTDHKISNDDDLYVHIVGAPTASNQMGSLIFSTDRYFSPRLQRPQYLSYCKWALQRNTFFPSNYNEVNHIEKCIFSFRKQVEGWCSKYWPKYSLSDCTFTKDIKPIFLEYLDKNVQSVFRLFKASKISFQGALIRVGGFETLYQNPYNKVLCSCPYNDSQMTCYQIATLPICLISPALCIIDIRLKQKNKLSCPSNYDICLLNALYKQGYKNAALIIGGTIFDPFNNKYDYNDGREIQKPVQGIVNPEWHKNDCSVMNCNKAEKCYNAKSGWKNRFTESPYIFVMLTKQNADTQRISTFMGMSSVKIKINGPIKNTIEIQENAQYQHLFETISDYIDQMYDRSDGEPEMEPVVIENIMDFYIEVNTRNIVLSSIAGGAQESIPVQTILNGYSNIGYCDDNFKNCESYQISPFCEGISEFCCKCGARLTEYKQFIE